MTVFPKDLYYTKNHQWVRTCEEDQFEVGLTLSGVHMAPNVTFIELPEPEEVYRAGEEVGTVESIKTASDIVMPVTGLILEVNQQVISDLDLINQMPFSTGWLFRFRPETDGDISYLLSLDEYIHYIGAYDPLPTDPDSFEKQPNNTQ